MQESLTGTAAEWRVEVAGTETSILYEPPHAGSARATFVCAHGAGGHMADRGMASLAAVFRSCGMGVVRFNFLYSQKGSRRPDRMPELEQCYAAVITRAREELAPDRLLLGGRSMGGRVATMMASKGFSCDGLLLLAYPLHPAGKPDQLRDAHLPSIHVPVLCFNGTRDALCRRDLMERTLRQVSTSWTMHWLEGADHGFHVLKSSGRTDADVLREIGTATSDWLSGLERSRQ